jgi:hypothetical protein
MIRLYVSGEGQYTVTSGLEKECVATTIRRTCFISKLLLSFHAINAKLIRLMTNLGRTGYGRCYGGERGSSLATQQPNHNSRDTDTMNVSTMAESLLPSQSTSIFPRHAVALSTQSHPKHCPHPHCTSVTADGWPQQSNREPIPISMSASKSASSIKRPSC